MTRSTARAPNAACTRRFRRVAALAFGAAKYLVRRKPNQTSDDLGEREVLPVALLADVMRQRSKAGSFGVCYIKL
jgi:hypothetical protein